MITEFSDDGKPSHYSIPAFDRAICCTRPVDAVHSPPFRLRCQPSLIEGLRREVAEGLVRPFCIVDGLPGSQLLVELPDTIGELRQLIALLFVGALGPLHGAVELGERGDSTKSRDAPLLPLAARRGRPRPAMLSSACCPMFSKRPRTLSTRSVPTPSRIRVATVMTATPVSFGFLVKCRKNNRALDSIAPLERDKAER